MLLGSLLPVLLVVVLQFDGSLRPPRSDGLPSISNKLSSCAAAIFLGQSNNDEISSEMTMTLNEDTGHEMIKEQQQLVALGGQTLPIESGMTTSAHAEYNALLFGLQFLNQQLCRQDNDVQTTTTMNWLSTILQQEKLKTSSSKSTLLLIQGDCKTVIDQLSNKSSPRKLSNLHADVQSELNILKPHFDSIVVQHISRQYNELTDLICNIVLDHVFHQSIQHILKNVEQYCNHHPSSSPIKQKKKTNLQQVSPMIEDITNCINKLVPHSKRPTLYQWLAARALEIKDGHTMIVMGNELESNAKVWPSSRSDDTFGNENNNDRKKKKNPLYYYYNREFLTARAAELQIEGYNLLGNERLADKVRRKHWFLLHQHKQECVPPSGHLELEIDQLRHASSGDLLHEHYLSRDDNDNQMPNQWTEALSIWQKEAVSTYEKEQQPLYQVRVPVWIKTMSNT